MNGNKKAMMASTVIEDLTRLVEQHGDLPVLVGFGHTLLTPLSPKVVPAVRETRVRTMFVCHRPLLSDTGTMPVIHLGWQPQRIRARMGAPTNRKEHQ